ncbi:MAG: ABC transporter permease [Anaerolineaceae bacterium]|jgi:simple sugar transport system permease protein
MANQTERLNLYKDTPRRRYVWGILLIVVGIFIVLAFGLNAQAGQISTFGMNLSSSNALTIPDILVPAQLSIYILALITIGLGAWQLAHGIRSMGILISVLAFTFIASFLVWAAAGKSFNLEGMISTALVRATPIALASLCGIISERTAVINIGIECTMLISAQTAVVAATLTHSLTFGLFVAIVTGALVAALHAVLCIHFKVNHIISGTAVNILGTGITTFISQKYLEQNIDLLNNSGTFPTITIPVLSKIPIIGPALFENNIIVFLMLLLVICMQIMLFFTPWGLRTRSVGEHPRAADTLGINVFLTRYVNTIIGGMIAGIGGAYFTIGSVGRFDQDITAGKGFIGLAAMIFGNYTPVGAFSSSVIFGFADSLQVKMQILSLPIPSQFLQMIPYIVTIIVLAGVVGRASVPAADGEAYEKQ